MPGVSYISSECGSDAGYEGIGRCSSEVMLGPVFDRPGCLELAQVCCNFS